MLGRSYAKYPEILIDSYSKIGNTKPKSSVILKTVQKIYIRIFGIPEIGFQLRGRYFLNTLNSLQEYKPKRILDAGSGIGYYAMELNKRYPNAKIDGIDIDKYKLEFCKKLVTTNNLKNINFQYKNLESQPLTNNIYDLIVNIDVLEHVNNYRDILKKFYSSLKPGGLLYIHTPQINQQRIFKGFFRNWHHEDHVREGFNPTDLKNELNQLGFKNIILSEGFGLWGKLAWELNTIAMDRSLVIGSILFPIWYLISLVDNHAYRNHGLTLFLLATK
jgi:SAM-dependent methyltransferase